MAKKDVICKGVYLPFVGDLKILVPDRYLHYCQIFLVAVGARDCLTKAPDFCSPFRIWELHR